MNNMINIVIPMAGAGSRFSIAGYNVPKPFIEFDNKMMIEHVLNSFKKINANFILILQEKFLTEQEKQIKKITGNYNFKLVTVPKLTMGAAITALAAHKAINPNYDIIFADSDNIFNPNDIENFVNNMREKKLVGGLLTFKSNKPCYSYVRLDKKGMLIETREKEVISEHAISGVYYFNNLSSFRDAVIDLIVCNDLTKGEFYMSNVYNHLKKTNTKIGIFDINHFDCVGTPKQLERYIEERKSAKI